MTRSLKYKLRGAAYIIAGAFLLISGIYSWDGLNFIWGTSSSLSDKTGNIKISVIIIGIALIAASYFEFLNARIYKDEENSDKDP